MVALKTTPQRQRMGWVDDPHEVDRVVSTMEKPVMGLAASREFLKTEHRDVFLWEQGEVALFGKVLPAHRQTIGDCVSHGWGRAVQDLVFIEMARQKVDPNLALQIATEPLYAFSRVEVGGGRIRGDGSIGAWAAKAVMNYGNLQRKKYGSIDLTNYSGNRARSWGAPRAGVPDELEPTAREYPIRMAPLVTTEDEAASSLYNMYPIPVCSGQGFTTTRDRYGFCDPRGSWAHCMVARAIARLKRGNKIVLAVVIQQSWGESPTGTNKVTTENGREVTLPQGCFAVEFDVFVRMLRQRDSFAPAGPEGFVPRMPNFTL